MDSRVLLEQSDVVELANLRGLAVSTYGHLNNDPAFIAKQSDVGMAAAIVDDVRGIVQALRASEPTQL